MYCWNAVLTTIGTLMGTENYPMHGQDLHGLPSWTKDLQTVIPGPGGVLQKDEQHPCQITCGQKCGQICQTLLNNEKSKSGSSKNRNSTMCENYEVFTSLTQKTQGSRKPWKRIVSCKITKSLHRETCCHSQVKNLHASWKPTNPQESVWKEPYLMMMTTLQEKDVTLWFMTNLCTSLLLCSK